MQEKSVPGMRSPVMRYRLVLYAFEMCGIDSGYTATRQIDQSFFWLAWSVNCLLSRFLIYFRTEIGVSWHVRPRQCPVLTQCMILPGSLFYPQKFSAQVSLLCAYEYLHSLGRTEMG
eukprot:1471751-Rhodomonas_salina.2